ncbi:MAG: helix-turn-helix transcriptional regulator [Alphaproteobacteria bacterium]
MTEETETKYITREQASQYLTNVLGCPTSFKTLCKFATTGGGPKYVKFGSRRVLYTIEALNEWASGRLSQPVAHSSQEVLYGV